jgi:SH3-like domain-containing protein
MTRLRLAVLALLCAASATVLAAGETQFQPGKPPPNLVLPQVPVKAVVAEFLDPDEVALGKEAGFLLWREILSAISDQSGAGVILAFPPGKERLTELLARDYHDAALNIARSQNARMAIWGAVAEDEGKLLLDTYLSLVGDVPREELALRLTYGMPGQPRTDSGFAARPGRTNFNLPRVVTTRAALFDRAIAIQASGAQVREQPNAGAVLATLSAETSLRAVDMQADWFRVRLPDGREGWVNCRLVRVAPPQVQARQAVTLRAAAGMSATLSGPLAAGTRMTVLASRYVDMSGMWYQISVGERRGWVPATEVLTRYSLPIVHLVAGLYRYQLGRYGDAAREFEQYTLADGVQADPPSLSSAYQLLAASRAMAAAASSSLNREETARDINRALDQAQRTTPYDPGVFTMRAVTTLATRRSLEAALPSISRALELDGDNRDARNVLQRINDITFKPSDPAQQMFPSGPLQPPKLREDILKLNERYRLAPK